LPLVWATATRQSSLGGLKVLGKGRGARGSHPATQQRQRRADCRVSQVATVTPQRPSYAPGDPARTGERSNPPQPSHNRDKDRMARRRSPPPGGVRVLPPPHPPPAAAAAAAAAAADPPPPPPPPGDGSAVEGCRSCPARKPSGLERISHKAPTSGAGLTSAQTLHPDRPE